MNGRIQEVVEHLRALSDEETVLGEAANMIEALYDLVDYMPADRLATAIYKLSWEVLKDVGDGWEPQSSPLVVDNNAFEMAYTLRDGTVWKISGNRMTREEANERLEDTQATAGQDPDQGG